MTIRGDEPLSAGSGPDPEAARGLVDEAGAADAVAGPSVSGSGGATVSAGEGLGGGAAGDPPGGGPGRSAASSAAGPDDGPRADGAFNGGRLAGGPVGGLSADSPVDGLPDDGPVEDPPTDDPVDDLPDDGPAVDGGGMSPVVREYVERLRSEALARDAELRAQGIDPCKGTGVDEGPHRRLGARALAALVVLVVAAVSVGAYVVFFCGEPDYGMSHGYQVQSDGSLKRPSAPVHQPDAPAELLRFTDDASEIAATHYFEVVAYAWNTGDTQYLRAFSSPDCQFCKKTAEEIERLYTEGGWGSGAAYSNMTTEMLGKSEDAATFGDQSYGVRVRYHERTPDLYHDHSFQQSRESDNNLIVIVHWDGQRWLIRDIGKEGDE